MASNSTVVLNGKKLVLEDIFRIVSDKKIKIELDKEALKRVNKSHKFLIRELRDKVIYGVNTGFGPMASYMIPDSAVDRLQVNLIRSHAVGMGEYINDDYVIAAMVVRLNGMLAGWSGVSVELVEHLQNFINNRIYPLIPEHGAVGTSGDLVQLAHIALALIGEGKVRFNDEIVNASEALKKTGIKRYELKVKEGLALINGTSLMSGIGSLLCVKAARLLNAELSNSILALELTESHTDAFSEKLHKVRPHRGQVFIAKKIREGLVDSKRTSDREVTQHYHNNGSDVHEAKKPVQEVYSLRCTPQILGPIYDTLAETWKTIDIEINSVTDNPIVDYEAGLFYHGGNFHGDYVASAVDKLKMALVKLTILSERRVNYFLNSNVNKAFPPFLNINTPGLTLGLQGLQFVATSTTAQSQTLGYPQYLHSIPTNADNQDVVSMGTDAALLCAKVLDNAFTVQTIESVSLAQAVDCLSKGIDGFSTMSRDFYNMIRESCMVVYNDRQITQTADIKARLENYDLLEV